MPVLSWVRVARRVNGLIRQPELPNLEALIDLERDRQPYYNYFILSCAIPAGIGTFGGLSVFAAWLSGNKGLPLILGTTATVILSFATWLIFFRLYKSVPASKQKLRKLISKFAPKYASFGNMIAVDPVLSDDFGRLLDEAAGIYLRHFAKDEGSATKAVRAMDEAMTRLMEVAVTQDRHSQDQALIWAEPMVEELRLLDTSLTAHALAAQRTYDDPLSALREARVDLESAQSALNELSDHA